MHRAISSPRQLIWPLAVLAIITAALFFAAMPVAAQGTPNPPTAITVVKGDTEAKVSWTAPTNNSACPVTDYTVTVYNPSNDSDEVESYTASTSYTVVGLTPGTEYKVEVWTYSAQCDEYSTSAKTTFTTNSGNDDNADPVHPQDTQGGSPNPPTALTARPGNTEVEVSWAAATVNNDCPVTDYTVTVYNPSDDSDEVESYTTSTSYTAVGLTASTDYKVEVWTYSAQCDEYSTSATATFTTNSLDNTNDPVRPPSDPKQAPKAPTGVTANVSSGTATITWTAPATEANRCDIVDYSVQVVNLSDSTAADKEQDYLPGTSTTVAGLTSGESYVAYVWGYSEECDNWSAAGKANFQG